MRSIQFGSQHPATSSSPTAKTIKAPKSIEANGLVRNSAPFFSAAGGRRKRHKVEKWRPMNLLRSIPIGYTSLVDLSQTILPLFRWQQTFIAQKRPASNTANFCRVTQTKNPLIIHCNLTLILQQVYSVNSACWPHSGAACPYEDAPVVNISQHLSYFGQFLSM